MQPQHIKAPKQLNVLRLKSNIVKQSLTAEMDSKLGSLCLGLNDVEADRASFRDTIVM